MKNLLKITLSVLLMLTFTLSYAQIKNAKTEIVKVYGNCGMCEKTIEKAGNKKKISKVDWDKNTKMATITYNTKKTNQDEILKRIALSGYDSDSFRAPDEAYANLPECCQYERNVPNDAKSGVTSTQGSMKTATADHTVKVNTIEEVPQPEPVFDHYFALKDELVKSDANAASVHAKSLLNDIAAIKMDKLTSEEHTIWMKVMKGLEHNAKDIAEAKDISKQRKYFIALSNDMYTLMKVSKQKTPTYFQHCPMANEGKGADWLSKENEIKNPYYGAQMLKCGKTVETIN